MPASVHWAVEQKWKELGDKGPNRVAVWALKTGFEYVVIRTQVLDVNPLYGLDSYAGGFSRPAGGPATGGRDHGHGDKRANGR